MAKIGGRTKPVPKIRKFLGGGIIFKSLIRKLLGTPFSNIPKWLFEKRKVLTPNPFKPTKKKITKEKKMHIPSLQKTLIGFRNKINDIATEINKLPKLETEIEKRFIQIETEMKMVKATKSIMGHTHMSSPTGGPTTPSSGRKGGKLKKGGRTTSSREECQSPVCMSIEDADTGAGTLDIYMINQAVCWYCNGAIFDNQTDCENYTGDCDDEDYDTQYSCETYGWNNGTGVWTDGSATWMFDLDITENSCESSDINGDYFNGQVGGFQFELPGVTVTGASAPAGFTTSTTTSNVLGYSMTGATISPGSGILTQVSFSNFDGEICFGDDTGTTGLTLISAGNADYIAADWGDCFCLTYIDCNNECGGNAVVDCDNVCGGSAVEDECGECGGSTTNEDDCICPDGMWWMPSAGNCVPDIEISPGGFGDNNHFYCVPQGECHLFPDGNNPRAGGSNGEALIDDECSCSNLSGLGCDNQNKDCCYGIGHEEESTAPNGGIPPEELDQCGVCGGCDECMGGNSDKCGVCINENYVAPFEGSLGYLYPSTQCCEENCEDFMDGSCSGVFCDSNIGYIQEPDDCTLDPNNCAGAHHYSYCRDATGTPRPYCACKCSFNNNTNWAWLGAMNCTPEAGCNHSPITNWIPNNWPRLDEWNFVIPPEEYDIFNPGYEMWQQEFQVCLENSICNNGSCIVTETDFGNNCGNWGASEDLCSDYCPVQPSGENEMCCSVYRDWDEHVYGGCNHGLDFIHDDDPERQEHYDNYYGICDGRAVGRTTDEQNNNEKQQLQSMSVDQLQETKIQLQSKPRKMRAGGTIKIGDVVKDMNST